MTRLRDLWDFDDPAGSEVRFRAAADEAEGDERIVLLTQAARALGLQERYDEGHALLDDLAVPSDEVAAHVSLERGRLLRSAGEEEAALPHFEAAEAAARDAGLDAVRVDAVHMVALVVPAEERIAVNERALELAGRSADPEARDWDASLLTNIGMVHADAGDFAGALAVFEQALVARERIGEDERTRVARWMVAWSLRNLGHRADALTMQRALKADLEAAGASDPHVDEELALLED
ncbi:tetratricopeptide repeat protein [Nocardioides mangrovi]|uniref:Tetratricopeptide repeat protein n=1 Tax=Nocardioides mangrovi TaxID=2874580 RepID=A0ABS7UF24_9ACTN|nr:tetratricopeptide repeat protein [Nocardioides mangrovi]MBZ5739609.1 tetratricopeptide repeat protein [Nocardioides mangrovi]